MGVKCLAQSKCSVNGSGDTGRSEGNRGNPSRQGAELHSWYMEQPSSGRENETNFLPEKEPGLSFRAPGVRMGLEAQHSAQGRQGAERLQSIGIGPARGPARKAGAACLRTISRGHWEGVGHTGRYGRGPPQKGWPEKEWARLLPRLDHDSPKAGCCSRLFSPVASSLPLEVNSKGSDRKWSRLPWLPGTWPFLALPACSSGTSLNQQTVP